jgi:hypothetical protein
VTFGLRIVDEHPILHPVDFVPTQRQVLARTTQTTEAAQREQQSPLGERAGVDDLLSIGAGNKKVPRAIALLSAF